MIVVGRSTIPLEIAVHNLASLDLTVDHLQNLFSGETDLYYCTQTSANIFHRGAQQPHSIVDYQVTVMYSVWQLYIADRLILPVVLVEVEYGLLCITGIHLCLDSCTSLVEHGQYPFVNKIVYQDYSLFCTPYQVAHEHIGVPDAAGLEQLFCGDCG